MTLREQLAQHIEAQLSKASEIKTVVRRLATYEELQNFAVTQFPVVCMVTGLPVTKEKLSARVQASFDREISSLTIDCYVYLQDVDGVDSTISDIASTLRLLILDDPRQGRLALSTNVAFEPELGLMTPFVAFKIIITLEYLHTTGGI